MKEWRSPLHNKKGAALPPRPTTVRLLVFI